MKRSPQRLEKVECDLHISSGWPQSTPATLKTCYITDKYPPIFSHMQYIANCSDNCLRVIIIYH